MIRHSKFTSESWKGLPWKKFRRNLFRLQVRLFKAITRGDLRRTRSLQKLILKSQAAIYLAIRQVTQLNAGKKTAGVDGQASLNHQQRFNLATLLNENVNTWKHQKLREIPIPKKDGTTRMLKVPTIADRAWQCLVKYAIEPAHEATFHERSFGFRPGRSAHDTQKILFSNLSNNKNGIDKRVLELDIEKCFDRINHNAIMKRLIAPANIKLGIFRCLKAGTNVGYPDQGTPQGGVISPLLANIALNGIEELHFSGKNRKDKANSNVIRYADDLVVILKPGDNEEEILKNIDKFLADRGMKVNEKKTKVTATTDGFDFLGWHFQVQKNNGKFRSRPSKDNFKVFRRKVKEIVNSSNYGLENKVKKLAPVVRGWLNYHKYCNMDKTNGSLYHIKNRALKVFNKCKRLNRHTAKELIKKSFPTVAWKEHGFINVKGKKSPFDGDLIYWSERNSKLYDGTTSKLLKKQNHACASCNHKFMEDEKVHLHHIDGNHHNWVWANLEVLHESCHDYKHMGKAKA